MDDLLAREASAALVDACGGSAEIAEAAGVTTRQAHRYATSRACPLYPASQLIRRSPRRWQMVRHFVAAAVLGDIEEVGALTEMKARQLWAEADQEDVRCETADLNERVAFEYSGNLAHLYEADARVLGPALKRMALTLVCRRYGWDPRPRAHERRVG